MDGWSGVDTPQTVMTTRAPAVLTNVNVNRDKNTVRNAGSKF